MRRANAQPACDDLDQVRCVARNRIGNLFSLQCASQQAAPRIGRGNNRRRSPSADQDIARGLNALSSTRWQRNAALPPDFDFAPSARLPIVFKRSRSTLLCSLRGLLRVRNSIVDFEPLERCRFGRIESEFLDLFAEELALFRMIVETACLHFFSPAFDFVRRFLFAVLVEPFHDFLVACALFDLRFEVVALHTFETKDHVIERTIEVIFANISRYQRATFIDCTSKNRVTANANPWTAWRFFRQIFSRNFLFHIVRVSNKAEDSVANLAGEAWALQLCGEGNSPAGGDLCCNTARARRSCCSPGRRQTLSRLVLGRGWD